MPIDSRSRAEDILHVTLGDMDPSVLQPPQSRVEVLLQRLYNEIGEIGGKIKIHICTSDEYDHDTGMPTVENPEENIFYLVPTGTETDDMYAEWIYTVENRWERFGSGGGSIGISQSDWNQNDSTANDYIKNKPDLSLKLDKNQGAANVGKFMGVNSSGNVIPLEVEGGNIAVIEELVAGEDYEINVVEGETGSVISVAGKTGTVTLNGNDVGYSPAVVYNNGTVGYSLKNIEDEYVVLQQTVDKLGGDKIPLDYSDFVPSEETIKDAITNLKSQITLMPNNYNSDAEDVDLDIADPSGNVILRLSDGHIKTKEFDSRNITNDLIMEDDADADLDVTDSFGNVLLRLQNGHIKTKGFDSEHASEQIIEELHGDIDDIKGDVEELQKETSGVLYRNKDITDGVYAICRWHQPRSTDKQFCLLISGDIHGDWTRMSNIVEYLNAIDAFDAGIMLGDIAYLNYTYAYRYTESISHTEKPLLTVVGNHDVTGNVAGVRYDDISEVYDQTIAPNIQYADLAEGEHPSGACYYYKDFTGQKIRIIVLCQYEYPSDKADGQYTYPGGYICYSQAQINWFIDVLNNTPSDYGVIIAVHNWVGAMTVDTSSVLTASTRTNTFTPAKCIDGVVIPEIVDAWMSGSAYRHTYTYTPGGTWTSLTVNADFTSRGAGEFITYIGGHWHMTLLSKLASYPNQKSYHVDCAGLSAAQQGDTPRREGTRSEDAFCAMAVDRDQKTVKIVRIGAHISKDAVDRLLGEYSYGAE